MYLNTIPEAKELLDKFQMPYSKDEYRILVFFSSLPSQTISLFVNRLITEKYPFILSISVKADFIVYGFNTEYKYEQLTQVNGVIDWFVEQSVYYERHKLMSIL